MSQSSTKKNQIEQNQVEPLVFNAAVEADILTRISERLAHDCNNLLARVMAIGEEFQFHLEDGTLFPEGPRLIRQNVLHTKELLLRIARLPQKSGPGSYHDLNSLVAEAAGLAGKFLPQSVQIETLPAPEALPVYVDAPAFRWVLIELAWTLAAVFSRMGTLSFATSRQPGPARPGSCLLMTMHTPVKTPAGTLPDKFVYVEPFVEKSGAIFSVEKTTTYRLCLPETETA